MGERVTENDVLGEVGAKVLRAAATASDDTCDPLAVAVNAMLCERMAQAFDAGFDLAADRPLISRRDFNAERERFIQRMSSSSAQQADQ